ncbi:hypothetical protein MRX96_050465 [Rhipicephalus microplus]
MACRVPRHIPLAPTRPAADHTRRYCSPPLSLSLFRAGTCVETRRRTGGFGQPQSSHLWCPLAHPAKTATDPAQAVERQREHDHTFGSGDHPVPVSPGGPAQGHTAARACTGAAACDHGAARSRDGAQHGESAAHREPRGSAAGHVSGWTCAGHFPAEPDIPGLGHSPILIQGALGQTQSSLGQIQGVQLALRPPHATGLTLGPQTGPRPHGGHPGPPGTPTLVIPQNLGPTPNIFLAPPRIMSPPSSAIVPGQPLTLQQLQAMLPTQTMLAQPTLGAFQTD